MPGGGAGTRAAGWGRAASLGCDGGGAFGGLAGVVGGGCGTHFLAQGGLLVQGGYGLVVSYGLRALRRRGGAQMLGVFGDAGVEAGGQDRDALAHRFQEGGQGPPRPSAGPS